MDTKKLFGRALLLSMILSGNLSFAWAAGASPDPDPASLTANMTETVSLSEPVSFSIAGALTPGFTIRRTAPEVHIQFTVADERGRLVTGLSDSDIRVVDSRASTVSVRKFAKLSDLPLNIGILMDVSDSMQKTIGRQSSMANTFLDRIFRPKSDHVFVSTFSDSMEIQQPFTKDREALRRSLEQVKSLGHITYLYDNLYRVCVQQFSSEPGREYAQRVLILISDGNDTGSLRSLSEAVGAAQRREIQVFAISLHPARGEYEGDATLKKIADSTGGQFFVLSSDKELSAVLSAMEQQMRTQYSISFQPANQKSGFHMVRIEMANGEKRLVRARLGYFVDEQ